MKLHKFNITTGIYLQPYCIGYVSAFDEAVPELVVIHATTAILVDYPISLCQTRLLLPKWPWHTINAEHGDVQKRSQCLVNSLLTGSNNAISTFFNHSQDLFLISNAYQLSIVKETPLQYPFLKALLSSGTTSNVIIQLIFGRTRYLFGKNKEKNKEIIKDTLLDMKDNLMTNKVMELRVEQLAYLWSLRPSSLPLLSTFCGNNSGIF